MSFEGYYEQLCHKGHLSIDSDLYVLRFDRNKICFIDGCEENIVWWNLVDETNDPIPEGEPGGPTKLKLKTEKVWEECHSCGHRKLLEEKTYEIPEYNPRVIR